MDGAKIGGATTPTAADGMGGTTAQIGGTTTPTAVAGSSPRHSDVSRKCTVDLEDWPKLEQLTGTEHEIQTEDAGTEHEIQTEDLNSTSAGIANNTENGEEEKQPEECL